MMKLVVEPVVKTQTIVIKRDNRTFLDRMLKRGEEKIVEEEFSGLRYIEPIVISGWPEECDPLQAGKISVLHIKPYHLYGVIPIKRLDNGDIECIIDHFVKK